MRTIKTLIADIKKQGIVCVDVDIATEIIPLRLHKTELLKDLVKIDPECMVTYQVREWNTQSKSGYWLRHRQVTLNRREPDKIPPVPETKWSRPGTPINDAS
jgi:hypothetical protein